MVSWISLLVTSRFWIKGGQLDLPVGDVTFLDQCFFKVVSRWFHGFWLVSMGFQGGFMVFCGFWLVSMAFQGGFMVFGWFPWFFKVVSWLFMVFGWFPWFFKVVSWFFMVFGWFP